jgi:hypothetical protein
VTYVHRRAAAPNPNCQYGRGLRLPMKCTSLLIIATLVGTPATYGQALGSIDLRGVILGATCEHAVKQELSLNSRPVTPVNQMTNNHALGFNDLRTPDQPKLIIYKCDESGQISGFSIFIASRAKSDAGDIYATIKADFEAKFGPPAVDSDRFNALQKKLLAGIFLSATSQWTAFDDQVLTINVDDPPDSKGVWNVRIGVNRPLRKH